MTRLVQCRAALLAGLLALAPAALAETGDCAPGPAQAGGTVERVIDGETLLLKSGAEVLLINAAAPRRDAGLAEQARLELAALIGDEPVTLSFGGRRQDRYGRLLAHVFAGTGENALWVQGEMVGRGLAVAYSFRDNRACMGALLARESAARKARRGVWTSLEYAVRAADRPESLSGLTDSFQIVEGEVISTGATGQRVYLNFGRRWKTDFTGIIASKDLDLFASGGILPLKLPRRRVRLRGWLAEHDGPLMTLDHPEQIELIDDDERTD